MHNAIGPSIFKWLSEYQWSIQEEKIKEIDVHLEKEYSWKLFYASNLLIKLKKNICNQHFFHESFFYSLQIYLLLPRFSLWHQELLKRCHRLSLIVSKALKKYSTTSLKVHINKMSWMNSFFFKEEESWLLFKLNGLL